MRATERGRVELDLSTLLVHPVAADLYLEAGKTNGEGVGVEVKVAEDIDQMENTNFVLQFLKYILKTVLPAV